MNAFLTAHKDAIEAFVNSPAACDLVEDTFDDAQLRAALDAHLGTPVPDDLWEVIANDLYDWWKNGNFVVHTADEPDPFNIGAWTIDNDPYFAERYDELT